MVRRVCGNVYDEAMIRERVDKVNILKSADISVMKK